MQTTISLLGCLQCHIRQSNRETYHINLSTCACLYFITASTYLLAHCNLAWAVLKLLMKHISDMEINEEDYTLTQSVGQKQSNYLAPGSNNVMGGWQGMPSQMQSWGWCTECLWFDGKCLDRIMNVINHYFLTLIKQKYHTWSETTTALHADNPVIPGKSKQYLIGACTDFWWKRSHRTFPLDQEMRDCCWTYQ